jgi:hypothetical protein
MVSITTNIAYSGGATDYTIPGNVGKFLHITLYGAGGPFSGDGAGGLLELNIVDAYRFRGQVLRFRPGGVGTAPSGQTGGTGGFNGGGGGSDATNPTGIPGYGGSGATDFRFPNVDDTLNGRTGVAGGAGATGRNGTSGTKGSGGRGGAGTGQAGGNATGSGSGGGDGGGPTTGGAGGAAGSGGGIGQSGSFGQGANATAVASSTAVGKGGGGGGWYGGGTPGSASSWSTGGAGGGSNRLDLSICQLIRTSQGGGSAQGVPGKAIVDFIPTPQAPDTLSLTDPFDAEGIISTSPLVVNPDHEFSLNWRYKADTTNVSQHEASQIEYSYDGTTWTSISIDPLLEYSVENLTMLSYRIPAGTLLANKSVTLRVSDKNIGTEAFGPTASISFTTPPRPNTPTWVTPATAGNPNPVTALPFRAAWAGIYNMVPNPSFIGNGAHWGLSTNGLASWVSTPSFIDTGALVMTSVAAGDMQVAQLATTADEEPVVAGVSYTISAKFRAATVGRQVKVFVQFRDASQAVLSLTGGAAATDTTTGWTTASYTVVAPAGAAWARIVPLVVGTAAAGEIHYVDAVMMRASTAVDAYTASPGQQRWRVQQFDISDIGFTNPVWDSGWQYSSIEAGLLMPRVIGGTFVWRLTVHDGVIASDPADVQVTLAFGMPASDWKPLIPKIELEAYQPDGTYICNIPTRINPHYLEEQRGAGAGDFTIMLTDPTWAANPTLINVGNIIRVKDRGEYIGFWEITGHNPKVVQTDEGSAEAILVRGLGGYGAWPGKAIVWPERGEQDFDTYPAVPRTKRAFGVASGAHIGHWYSVLDWSGPYVQVVQSATGATSLWPGATANPWKASPSDWPSDLASASWIWGGWDARQVGPAGLFVAKVTLIVQPGRKVPVQLFMAADDEAQAYLDGDPWLYSNNWQSTAQSDVTWLGPGNHDLTFICSQGQYDTATANNFKNPAGLLAGVYIYSDAGQAANHAVFWKTDAVNSAVVVYPAVLPGWTVGDILQTLYGEALARAIADGDTSVFALFDLGFDFFQDSYGLPWPVGGRQWFFNIGDTYSSVFDQLSDTECDIWFDANLRLQAAPQRGVDRAQLTQPLTYPAVVIASAPYFYFDFEQNTHTGTVNSIAVTYLSDRLDTTAMLFSISSHDVNHWYKPITDGTLSNFQEPSRNLRGLVQKSPGDIDTVEILAKTALTVGGQAGFPITGPEGFCYEFVTSQAYPGITWNLYEVGADTSATGTDVPALLSFIVSSGDDRMADSFFLKVSSDASTIFFSDVYAYFRKDHKSHHWVMNFINDGDNSILDVYLDGNQIISMVVDMPWQVGWLVMVHQSGADTLDPFNSQAWGHLALYQRLLTPDDQVSNYHDNPPRQGRRHRQVRSSGGVLRRLL